MTTQSERPMTLTDFLLARIAEDEAAIGGWPPGYIPTPTKPNGMARLDYGGHLPVFFIDPERALAECEAKRRIVEEDASAIREGGGPDVVRGLEHVIHALASVYADHPDYREEWKR